MSNIWDKVALYRAAAAGPINADIDSLVNQIEKMGANILTSQTGDQINRALENIEKLYPRAKRYKKTRILSDTMSNIGENHHHAYKEYENAIINTAEDIDKNPLTDLDYKRSEWSVEGLDKMLSAHINDDGSRRYESLIDYFMTEQHRVNRLIGDMTVKGADGNLQSRPFRYNKNGIDDKDIQIRLEKYANQLKMGVEMLYEDGILTPQESFLLYTGDDTMYQGRKTENKANAKSIIDTYANTQDDFMKIYKDIEKIKDEDGVLAYLQQNPDMAKRLNEETPIDLGIDGKEAMLMKLQAVMGERTRQLMGARKTWLAWEGTPFPGTELPEVPDGVFESSELFPEDELDVQDKTFKAFQSLSPPEQTKYIEDQTKKYMAVYEKEKDAEREAFLAEEGFFADKPGLDKTIDIAKFGGAVWAYSSRKELFKKMTEYTQNVTSWFTNNTKLSANEISELLSNKNYQKVAQHIADAQTVLDDLGEKVSQSKIDKWKSQSQSLSGKNKKTMLKKIRDAVTHNKNIDIAKNKVLGLSKNGANNISKLLKGKVSPEDIQKLLNAKGWKNLNMIRKYALHDFPKDVKEFFTKGTLGKITSLGKGIAVVRGQYAVGETFAVDKLTEFVGKDVLGMDKFEEDALLNQLVTTAGGGKIAEKVMNVVWPRMKQLIKSKQGRRLLGYIFKESTIKRIAGAKSPNKKLQIALMGMGLYSGVKDFIGLLSDPADIENMSDEELDKFVKDKLDKIHEGDINLEGDIHDPTNPKGLHQLGIGEYLGA